ncbi:MAG: hypothetical protein FH749_08505 [Firmicutes bacterium]|nr:hypothetical protein [Bacillota bacterium]
MFECIESVCSSLGIERENLQVQSALKLDSPNPFQPLLVYPLSDQAIASQVKVYLQSIYPDNHLVLVTRFTGHSTENKRQLELCRLDQLEDLNDYTALYVPALAVGMVAGHIDSLLKIMALLRSHVGCPWDRKQTFDTLVPFVLEEAYEVVEAVNSKNGNNICEELGDLLLQIAFFAQISSEQDMFKFSDIVRSICQKLVHRHPHIFGDIQAESPETVEKIWRQQKRLEGSVGRRPDFPALLALEKAIAKGTLEPADIKDPLMRQLAELQAQAVAQGRCLEAEMASFLKNISQS